MHSPVAMHFDFCHKDKITSSEYRAVSFWVLPLLKPHRWASREPQSRPNCAMASSEGMPASIATTARPNTISRGYTAGLLLHRSGSIAEQSDNEGVASMWVVPSGDILSA